MHIVLVSADGGVGGLPQHIVDLSLGLIEAKDSVSVITPPGQLETNLKQTKKIEVIPLPFRSRFDLGTIYALRKIYAAIQTTPDLVVHVHGVRAGWLGRLAAYGRHVSIVYTEHLWTADYLPQQSWRKTEQLLFLKLLNRVTKQTIAVSEAVKRFLVDEHICPAHDVTVIHHALREVPSLLARPATGKLPIIGCLAALRPVKRVDVLIRACGLLLQDNVPFRLEIVGDGPERTSLERLARDLHLLDRVRFIGEVTAPLESMHQWSIAAVPSDSEAFSLVALEAQAMGLPVVATHVGGLPEVVTRKSGFLVPPADPPAMRKVLAELLAHPELRQKLGAAGREQASSFHFSTMIQKTREVYAKAIAGGS